MRSKVLLTDTLIAITLVWIEHASALPVPLLSGSAGLPKAAMAVRNFGRGLRDKATEAANSVKEKGVNEAAADTVKKAKDSGKSRVQMKLLASILPSVLGLLFLIALVALIVWYVRRKRREKEQDQAGGPTEET